MRYSIHILALSATVASALQLPNLQPFLSAFPISINDYIPRTQDQNPAQAQAHHQTQPQITAQHRDLFRRQDDDSDTCPADYNNCANIGAPGLCCSPSAVCSADNAGHVACCPLGAACTGSINGIVTGGATGSDSDFVAATSSGAGNSGLLVAASTTDNDNDNPSTIGGFVLDGGQTVATPGAGARGVEPPLVARAIIRMLEYLPV